MKTNGYRSVLPAWAANPPARPVRAAQCGVLGLVAVAAALLLAPAALAQTNTILPIFQYAIFYNSLLEFTWTETLTVNGRVHCNTNIYLGSSDNVTFNSTVSASGVIAEPAWFGKTTNQYTGSNYFKGNPGCVTNIPAMQLYGISNTPAILQQIIEMPPAGEDPNSGMGQQRYYNRAQVVIVVTNSSVTTILRYAANDSSPVTIMANYNPTKLAATNFTAVSSNFPFLSLTNYFEDQREGKIVEVSQIDVGALSSWFLTNANANAVAKFSANGSPGTYPCLLYIADTRNNTNTAAGLEMFAVRLTNGVAIPTNGSSGFTIATPNPLYVWGNYNTPNASNRGSTNVAGTQPALLVSDALTVLSSSWKDSTCSNTVDVRVASTTDTIDAAIITGNVPSTGPSTNQYSGGVDNLLRLLEEWSSSTLWLNTSLVNLFPSVVATNQLLAPGVYFYPPIREFNFNPNYLDLNQIPPGTPLLFATSNPAIIVQPQNETLLAGRNALFYVYAEGTQPLDYQWFINQTNAISGATNASLLLTNVQPASAADYSVAVSNIFGSITSSNAVLSVYATAAAVLGASPIPAGGSFQFSVAGVPGLNYAIEASTDLIDWVTLQTNTSPFVFVDTNSAALPQRFYRSVYLP